MSDVILVGVFCFFFNLFFSNIATLKETDGSLQLVGTGGKRFR